MRTQNYPQHRLALGAPRGFLDFHIEYVEKILVGGMKKYTENHEAQR